MRALRRHIIVRLIVCLLLTWAAADLLVPQLCSAEAATQRDGSPSSAQDQDDCFCCCSHTERARPIEVHFTLSEPLVIETFHASDLAAGVPRSLYHPPLAS